MASVYVSIGSNSNAPSNVCSCIQDLRTTFGTVQLSTAYQTLAVGFNGDPYVNLVVGFTTAWTLAQIQNYLRQEEAKHGRVRNGEKYKECPLDMDLLLYDNINLQPQQNLPHRDIERYAFVLYPLAEIAPSVLHPYLHKSLLELAAMSSLPRDTMTPISLKCINR